jgi:predicted glycosyltransferase
MDIKKSHVSELVENLYGQLLKRREHLYEFDENELPDWQIKIINEELERINKILNLIRKGKL